MALSGIFSRQYVMQLMKPVQQRAGAEARDWQPASRWPTVPSQSELQEDGFEWVALGVPVELNGAKKWNDFHGPTPDSWMSGQNAPSGFQGPGDARAGGAEPPAQAPVQPKPAGVTLAQKLLLLARLAPQVRGELMKDADTLLQLTRRPELLERLTRQPEALEDIKAGLKNQDPFIGLKLGGIRRFLPSGVMKVYA